MTSEDRTRILAHINADAERGRHCICGLVVVRRADAAGREDIIVSRSQRIHRRNDRLRNIRNHTCFRDLHAQRRQIFRDRL